MSILVLSEECDPTADAIMETLTEKGAAAYRVDLGWFPSGLGLDAELGKTGRWDVSMRTGTREISLVGLRSVLYRRPTAFTFPAGLSGPELRHARMEAKIALAGHLGSLTGVLWINHPARQADMHKPAQLAAARAVGLLTPRTLVTNRWDSVTRFATDIQGSVVIKPLGYASIVETSGRRALYTHVLTDRELADLRGVEVTAHMFQQYIENKEYELRLTVVGSGTDAQFFPVALRSDTPTPPVDFRASYDTLTYNAVDIPDDVSTGVQAFMQHFDINLGHFDFCVDTAGRHWFLECNGSGGQYQFIEQPTGLPITEAISDLLMKGRS